MVRFTDLSTRWKENVRRNSALVVALASIGSLVYPVVAQNPASREDLSLLLNAPQRAPLKWVASTDPAHKNQDYKILKPGETRRVPLPAGHLIRLWSTSSIPDKLELTLQNGATRIPLLHNNKTANIGNFHEKAFSYYPQAGEAAKELVLGANALLVATNGGKEDAKWFYQVTIGGPRRGVTPLPKAAVSQLKKVDVSPGGEVELWKAAGTGTVTHLILEPSRAAFKPLLDLRLKAWWDTGATKPAVDISLLELTAQFYDAQKVESSPVDFDGKRLTIRWPMPFGAGARLAIANSGDEALSVGGSISTVSAAPVAYRFCAASGSALSQRGKSLSILEAKGEGAFVGLALGIKPTPQSARRAFAYLEGNETIVVDGKSYEGTGTEDYFNSAWYFPEDAFTHPYGGMTFKKLLPPQVSMYRWMIHDAVPFRQSLKFEQEVGNRNNADDLEYRWAAFWYQKAPLDFKIARTLDADIAAENSAVKKPNRDEAYRYLWAIIYIILDIGVALILLKLYLTYKHRRSNRG